MKLLELDLQGFGRLVNRRFCFAPGFNLVVGPNETGKSTLQRAILAMLYGYFDDSTITAAKRELVAAGIPWDGTAPGYGGLLTYTLDDGQHYRVQRTFHPRPNTSLVTLPDKKDVTGQYDSASYGRVFFADKQLGMSREVFENICSVRQTELAALDGSANAITDTLMRLSASGSAETTVPAALAVLDQALSDQVGTARAWTKPLMRTTKKLSELEDERKQMRRERDELFVKVKECQQVEDELQRLDEEIQRLHYLQLCAEQERAASQLGSDAEVAKTIAELATEMVRWEPWSEFPIQFRDRVVPLALQREQIQMECAELQTAALEAERILQPILADIAATQERAASLADARNIRVEALPRVQELAAQWQRTQEAQTYAKNSLSPATNRIAELQPQVERVRQKLKPLIDLGTDGLTKLQQQLAVSRQWTTRADRQLEQAQLEWSRVGMEENQFRTLERSVQAIQAGTEPLPPERKGCSPFSFSSGQGVTQPRPEITLYGQIKPTYEELVQRRVEVKAAHSRQDEIEATITRQLGGLVHSPLNDGAFDGLKEQLRIYLTAETEFQNSKNGASWAKMQLESEARTEESIILALRNCLADLGFRHHDVSQSMSAYLSQCERRQMLEQEEMKLERLDLRAQALSRDIDILHQRQASLSRVESGLCSLLAQVGIECQPNGIDQALARFHDRVAGYRRWEAAKARYDEATREQALLESHNERVSTQRNQAELEARLRVMLDQHPQWVNLRPSQAPQEYVQQQKQMTDRQRTVRDRQRQLQDGIRSAADKLKHPAEIDEELAIVQIELRRLGSYRDALELARAELVEATRQYQKQFAPKLEMQLGDSLGHVTAGRYSQAQVDPVTLAVTISTVERDDAVRIGQLSTGTRDLVYLMLRIAIARLLSRTKESLPLMLDDPLVQFDRGRQERTLEFLSQLASDTQVFLFTKDEWTRGWFEQNLSIDGKHALHQLG